METYYKPSGKIGPLAIVYFLICACLAFPLLGAAYSYAIWYIPFFYLNFLIAISFGFAIGWLNRIIVTRLGKVRNVKLAYVFGLIGGLIGIYVSWAVWVDLVVNAGEQIGSERLGAVVSNVKANEVLNLILSPGVLWDFIREINNYGTWGFKSTAVSGTFLSVIWVLEFLIIVGSSTLGSFMEATKPFCETSNEWFRVNVLPPFTFILDMEIMEQSILKKDLKGFEDLRLEEEKSMDRSIFTLYESNLEENFLTISNTRAKINDKGDFKYEEDAAINYISINNAQKKYLLNIREARINQKTPELPADHLPEALDPV